MPRHPRLRESAFHHNDHGVWCPSCGEMLAGAQQVDDDWMEPDECRVCGFPEDIEMMAEHHLGID